MHPFVLMGQAWYTLHMVPCHTLQHLLRSCLTEGTLASGDSCLPVHQHVTAHVSSERVHGGQVPQILQHIAVR